MKKIKAFVTGATGFLGSHLVDRLLEQGAEVHVLVRKNSNLRWLAGKKVHYHYGDVVGDPKALQKGLKGIDHLYHLAGVIRARSTKTYYEVNAQGTANLLETCLKVNPEVKGVVIVTSLAAHGPNFPNSPNSDDQPATEEEECHPITDYGKSKRDAELIALRYVDRLPVTIIRPPAIYGPRDEQTLRLFQMAKKGVILIPGLGRKVVSLAYAQDVVTGILLAAENPKARGEIFFIAEDRNYEWEEAAAIIAKVVGSDPIKIRVPAILVYAAAAVAEAATWLTGRIFSLNFAYARNFLQRNWAIDISKAKKILGYRPAYSLTRGAEETAAWYKKEGWF